MLPGLDVGFTGDDFALLYTNQGAPWYFSPDGFYRPFRNGFFKLMVQCAGVDPLPYRVSSFLAYTLCAFLLYRFLKRLGLTTLPAIAALGTVFLTPRNHELLFSFAAIQDTLYSICILAMLLSWTSFRQQNRVGAWLASIVFYCLALGFKETAIIAPVLVLLTDWFIDWRFGPQKRSLRRWMPYLGFAVPVVGLAGFVYWYPSGAFKMVDAHGEHAAYGIGTILGGISAELRSIFNLSVPFVPRFALREIGLSLAIKIALIMTCLGGLIAVSRSKKIWVFAALWMLGL